MARLVTIIFMTLKERSDKHLSGVIGRFYELEISYGKGLYLVDTSGKSYLDFGSGIAVASTGHCHPAVTEAIKKQADTLIHPCIAMGYYEPLATVAEKITALTESDNYRVFFTQSGSEAVETALKCARYVSKRKKVIAFQGGFHGRTIGALSVTSSKKTYLEGYQLVEGSLFFPYPYLYRCPYALKPGQSEEQAYIEALENSDLFNTDVAAVIIEPVLGEAGYIPAPKAFLQALEKRCKQLGIYLIIDEIQTGIGRTGSWFCYQQSGLDPDFIVTAKGLGSGMPIGACLAKREIMDKWPKGAHGGTYGGNPIACAAANATLDVIQTVLPGIPALAKLAETLLREGLENHSLVGDIRVIGLMIGIEMVKDKISKEPNSQAMQDIMKNCLEKGLIVLSSGLHNNVLRLAPPLIIDEGSLRQGLSVLMEVIHDYR
jgi:4-aminobutyrate aminotransferase